MIMISGSLLVLILSIACIENVSVFKVFNAEPPTGWQLTAVMGRSGFVGQAKR